jgi:hypothetical protein
MNGDARKVEVLAPFNQALELTKQILFRPFDIEKWLVIAFAAFLAGWINSGGGTFNPLGFRNWNTHGPLPTFQYRSWNFDQHQGPVFLMILITSIVLGLALVVLWLWITSRGRFIFIDCLARNRAAIVAPWREFRREGNSYFLFLIVVIIVSCAVLAVLAVLVIVPVWWSNRHYHSPGLALFVSVPLALFGWFVFAVALNVVTYLMPPVMYVRRCSAFEAVRAVSNLILENAAPFILYVLFTIVLWIGWAVAGCLVTCATCCLAAIPYIGTALVLPVPVLFRSYSLLFLRQFGPDYDVWSVTTPLPAVSVQQPTVPPPPASPPPPEASPANPPPAPSEPQTPPPFPRSPYAPPDEPPSQT